MIIGIIFGIIFIVLIAMILVLGKNDSPNTKNAAKNKVPPITKGRSYPWFYIKECLFYFPITRLEAYDGETKESLVDKMLEAQNIGDFEKVLEICDEIIAIDYKFSRVWIDKINAIFNNALTGKEWKASTSKNVVNCCYNYIRSFSTNYDKSRNAKHLLIPAIVKRCNELIEYNRENTSETYNFEIYNLLINLYYFMPFNELLEVAYSNIDIGRNLGEIQQNPYGNDAIKSLFSHVIMLGEKHSVIIERQTVEELKITNKNIINDDTFSTSWIGFNIHFPKDLNKAELIFKFYDQRRQEIDLSNGSNKRIVELFEYKGEDKSYNIVILGEDKIKYVTIDLFDEKKKNELVNNFEENAEDDIEEKDNTIQQNENKETEKVEKEISGKQSTDKTIKEEILSKEEQIQDKNEEQTSQEQVVEEEIKEENTSEEKSDEEENYHEFEQLEYKVFPSFSDIKQIALSENYCLFLKEDGKVEMLGNADKSINVSEWENIKELYVTNSTVYAIRKDGTIAVTGKSVYDSWEYQYIWEDIEKLVPSYNHIVGLKKDGTVVAEGDNTHGQCNVQEWTNISDISVSFHTVGLNKDGKVFATGENAFGECDVENWDHIEKIATGPFYTVGLREDGSVVSTGLNSCGQCNTNDWKYVKEIYARGNITVGLKYDGTLLVAGRNSYRFEDAKKWQNIQNVKIVNDRIIGITSDGKINYIGKPYWGRIKEDWHNIKSLEANSNCVLGQKDDGSLICNKTLFGMYLPDNYEKFADIKENIEADKVVVLDNEGVVDLYNINNVDLYKWDISKFKNIKEISMSKTHLAGLKYDGTAVVTGNDISLAFELENWKNIIKIEVGDKFAVGLTIDGRVVATGNNFYGQCDVNDWLDIVDIAVCGSKTLGLKSDGTVKITGFLEYNEEDFIKKATNIVGITVNNKQIMLLNSDGKVELSYNPSGRDNQEVLEWRNVIKIVSNDNSFIGLKSDGSVVNTGKADLSEWKNINDIKASGNHIIGVIKIKQ